MGIAQAQVIVGDAPAARKQLEGKLHRLKALVAARSLEIRLALLSGFLKEFDDRFALQFVLVERGFDSWMLLKRGGQGNRVLHRQLCARADGEMGGMYSIAEQHGIVIVPVLVCKRGEADP